MVHRRVSSSVFMTSNVWKQKGHLIITSKAKMQGGAIKKCIMRLHSYTQSHMRVRKCFSKHFCWVWKAVIQSTPLGVADEASTLLSTLNIIVKMHQNTRYEVKCPASYPAGMDKLLALMGKAVHDSGCQSVCLCEQMCVNAWCVLVFVSAYGSKNGVVFEHLNTLL